MIILKTSKSFHLNLAENLLAKLPKTPNRYICSFISDYYEKLSLSGNSKLDSTTEDCLFKLLKKVEAKKAAGNVQISEKFLEDGERILI